MLTSAIDNDATVIRKLEAAGAVLLGKAAMIELAGGMGYRYASASATGRGQKSLEHRITGPADRRVARLPLPVPDWRRLPSARRHGAPSSALQDFPD